MRRRDVWILEIIAALVLFMILAPINTFYPIIFNQNAGWFSVVAIFITLLIFFGNQLLKEVNQEDSQIALLKALRLKITEIEKMADSYLDTSIAWYLFPLPDESLYSHKLDRTILGKQTDDLTNCINRVRDKLLIINDMMQRIQTSFDSFLVSNEINVTDMDDHGELNKNIYKKFSEDKRFRYYHPRIMLLLTEKNEGGFSYNLEKAKCILSERFGIK